MGDQIRTLKMGQIPGIVEKLEVKNGIEYCLFRHPENDKLYRTPCTNVQVEMSEKKKMSKKDDPCWSGYRMYGHKTKDGKKVPNCVPEAKDEPVKYDDLIVSLRDTKPKKPKGHKKVSKMMKRDFPELFKTPVENALKEHIERKVPLSDSIFRLGSKSFVEVFAEAKRLRAAGQLPRLDEESEELLQTDIGEWGTYECKKVPLDVPFANLNESEYQGKKVELNKPKRGGSKAYYVYVKNPDTDNVIKVEFGSGMQAKINDPEARKRYNDRHGCSKGRHNDKTKAG
ncbi:MAG: hypothetical protein ACK419_07035, partial [Pyrinomonadaceae bacterium]